jgi:hypothetical protein
MTDERMVLDVELVQKLLGAIQEHLGLISTEK